MIDVRDSLTLSDNNEYLVVSKFDYNGKIYYYLSDIKNIGRVKFCYLENTETLVEVTDNKLIQKLMLIAVKNMINYK